MGLYEKYILPRVIHYVCQMGPSMKQREKIVPLAEGNVLEIGIGSGLNLPYYDSSKVRNLVAIDPSEETWQQNRVKIEELEFGFEFVQAFAEDIPVDSNAIDTVIYTYTMCTIPDIPSAMEEMRRVLKPGGKLIFCEHGKAPDKAIEKWQNRLNPIWKQFSGGCQMNRDIPRLIEDNGFNIEKMDTMYIPGWKPASFNYWGTAEAR